MRVEQQIAVIKRKLQAHDERLAAITPDEISQAQRKLGELSRRMAARLLQQAVIEQVALLMLRQGSPDGLQVVAWLCRTVTDDPAWFKRAESASLSTIIEQVRAEL